MSSKIHHNTVKKARKFGIELVAVENEFEARKDGKVWGAHASASVALELALTNLEHDLNIGVATSVGAKPRKLKSARKERDTIRTRGKKDYSEDELLEDDADGDEPEQGRSIIKRKYKAAYRARPLRVSCSDDLAVQVASYLKVKAEDGKPRVDAAKLKAFARANDCWDPKYANINVGLRRMSIINRLRAKIRRDKHAVIWV